MKNPNRANPPQPVDFDLRRQRAATIAPIAIAFPVAIVLWASTYFLLPPLAGMEGK
ncbi:MAG: hypothetical protein ACR2KT_08205 [Methylocella sp.]